MLFFLLHSLRSCEYNFYIFLASEWPRGTYGIPESKNGCPVGFVHGSRTRMVKDYSASDNLNLAEYYNHTLKTITMKFCIKNFEGTGPDWPKGIIEIFFHCFYCFIPCRELLYLQKRTLPIRIF